MNQTKIEWCDSTWNPITGCLHGCAYCYARNIAKRFAGCYDPNSDKNIKQSENGVISLEHRGHVLYKTKKGQIIPAPYPYGFAPTLHRYRLEQPSLWTKPRNIFVGSMADVFGDWVPDSWLQEVFKACEAAPQHRYLFLTKNPVRYEDIPNCNDKFWYGATATTQESFILALDSFMQQWVNTQMNSNSFLRIEPLHGEIVIGKCNGYFSPLSWVIIGAETGNRKNKIIPKREWIENIVDECRHYGIPVFMKNSLEQTWGEVLIQEFPW